MKLSIIIPTYNERDNIKELLLKLQKELTTNLIDGEIIIVDDNSPDGTGDILEKLKENYSNLKIIHREGKLGLSSAVLEGFEISRGDVLGVMDADLSHPVEKVLEMLNLINNGADFVVGSRYIKGAKIIGWTLDRKIFSKIGIFFARLFTNITDPMSGFFLFKKELLDGKKLDPRGFKILLEMLIKLNYKNLMEVPIIFTNRTVGKSKAGVGEVFSFFRNLYSYLPYKKDLIYEFLKFSFVGFIGTLINITILYLLTENSHIYYLYSASVAFIIAFTLNFILNKIWTFKYNTNNDLVEKYFNSFLVSLMALIVNLFFLYIFTEFFKIYYLISQAIAIGFSLLINFIGNKIWIFKK